MLDEDAGEYVLGSEPVPATAVNAEAKPQLEEPCTIEVLNGGTHQETDDGADGAESGVDASSPDVPDDGSDPVTHHDVDIGAEACSQHDMDHGAHSGTDDCTESSVEACSQEDPNDRSDQGSHDGAKIAVDLNFESEGEFPVQTGTLPVQQQHVVNI